MGMGNGPIGINGVKVRGCHLFYTNTATASFFKIPIDSSLGTATGPAILITSGVPGDDFTFDKQGDAWVANTEAELVLLPMAATAAPGSVVPEVEAGSVNSTVLAGVTAAEFGYDGELFLSTSGGLPQYLTGNFTLGGTISRVRVGY